MFSMSDDFSNILIVPSLVDNVNTVICRVVHILSMLGVENKIVRFGKGYA